MRIFSRAIGVSGVACVAIATTVDRDRAVAQITVKSGHRGRFGPAAGVEIARDDNPRVGREIGSNQSLQARLRELDLTTQ